MVGWLWGRQAPSSLLEPLEQGPGEVASSWPSPQHWLITTALESRAKPCTIIPRDISMFHFSHSEESHFSELYLFRTKMTRNCEFTVPESLTRQNPAFQEFLLWKEIKPSKFCTGALTTLGLLLPPPTLFLRLIELTLTGYSTDQAQTGCIWVSGWRHHRNGREEMAYLSLLVSMDALFLISLQYYISFVNYEIASLLLQIHITCRQSCC